MRQLTVEFKESDGPIIISAARETILQFLKNGRTLSQKSLLSDLRFEKKLGCFTTLRSDDPEKTLRGCIGFPEPIQSLSKALTESAIGAATQDPRFPSLQLEELQSVLIEVSILTKPQIIKARSPTELPNLIELGKDGLILRWAFGSGLLLPQVAREYNWDAEEFLTNVSMKAGAPPDQWLIPGTELSKFQAIIFQESSPNGPVHLIDN